MNQTLIRKSRKLSRLLRHDTVYAFPQDGWRRVEDLTSNHGFTLEELETIVAEDSKGRYEFSADRHSIRARYGHTIPVNPDLTPATPPDILYHGTATRFLDSIRKTGIRRMGRNYVHLSPTPESALQVGSRHGVPVIIEVDAKRMAADGIVFYQTRNGIWLTEYVDNTYCQIMN